MQIIGIGFKQLGITLGSLNVTLDQLGVKNTAQIGRILLDDVHEHFKDQGKDVGGWAKHSSETVKRYGVHPLLVLDGDLYRSFSIQASPRRVYLTSNSKKLHFSEFGTSKEPARPVMYISAKAADKIFLIPVSEIAVSMRK